MPPTSRGRLLLRTIYRTPPTRPQFLCSRHVSFKHPTKIPEGLRPVPKKIIPEAVPEVESIPKKSRKPPSRARTLYTRFRGSAASRGTVRFLLWLPILIVVYENFPLAYWPIEGGSMQPTFNPSYTSESGIINTKDHVLVLKQPSSNTFRYLRSFLPSRHKRADLTPQRGQIVVFITPHDHTKKSIKRVVAIPGDLITPLAGYPNGTNPITIPYNHVWVEGDVSDMTKSLDSNHFGPISANLLIGRVLVTLPAFQPWWDGTRWEDASYPARNRVEESTVRPLNPDEEDGKLAFRDGRISSALDVVKAYPPARPLNPMERERWQTLYRIAVSEKGKKDIETYELANALEAELRIKLSGKAITTTLKNVEMSREEFEKFQKEGVVPEAVLKRAEGA